MMTRVKGLIAVAGLLTALSTASFGATANGSFSYGVLGCCGLDGGIQGAGDLMTADTVTFQAPPNITILSASPLTFGLPNDFVGLVGTPGSLLPTTLDLTGVFNPVTLTFGALDQYSFTAISQVRNVSLSTRTISFYFLGTFADSTVGGFEPADASLTLNFSQTASNSDISGAGTFSTPPQSAPIPEPATMGLMGTALLGAGILRFRKRA